MPFVGDNDSALCVVHALLSVAAKMGVPSGKEAGTVSLCIVSDMGRARQGMAPARTGRRRQTTKAKAGAPAAVLQTTPATANSASGFDPNVFAPPAMYDGDFASVDAETADERDSYYGGPDDYYSEDDDYYSTRGNDYHYQVIVGVSLDVASPNSILLTLMRRLEGQPLAAELQRNPYFFYGAGRAAQRFAKKLEHVNLEWESEKDYYGDRVSSIEVGPEYGQALAEFQAEIEELYALSVASQKETGANNRIIERACSPSTGASSPNSKANTTPSRKGGRGHCPSAHPAQRQRGSHLPAGPLEPANPGLADQRPQPTADQRCWCRLTESGAAVRPACQSAAADAGHRQRARQVRCC